jgi:hypothetical protein
MAVSPQNADRHVHTTPSRSALYERNSYRKAQRPSGAAGKPEKPYPYFPLPSQASRAWQMKIRGKIHCFGERQRRRRQNSSASTSRSGSTSCRTPSRRGSLVSRTRWRDRESTAFSPTKAMNVYRSSNATGIHSPPSSRPPARLVCILLTDSLRLLPANGTRVANQCGPFPESASLLSADKITCLLRICEESAGVRGQLRVVR